MAEIDYRKITNEALFSKPAVVKTTAKGIAGLSTADFSSVEQVVKGCFESVKTIITSYKSDPTASIFMTLTQIAQVVVVNVEKLDKLGVKGENKKKIAMTIIENVVDSINFKVKVFGIPMPFAKEFIKQLLMKYAEKLIDWLVANLLTKKIPATK